MEHCRREFVVITVIKTSSATKAATTCQIYEIFFTRMSVPLLVLVFIIVRAIITRK